MSFAKYCRSTKKVTKFNKYINPVPSRSPIIEKNKPIKIAVLYFLCRTNIEFRLKARLINNPVPEEMRLEITGLKILFTRVRYMPKSAIVAIDEDMANFTFMENRSLNFEDGGDFSNSHTLAETIS